MAAQGPFHYQHALASQACVRRTVTSFDCLANCFLYGWTSI